MLQRAHLKQVRCNSRPETFRRSRIKTGLLHILHGSDLLPGSIIKGLEDLLGVLDPLEHPLEPVMYLKKLFKKNE